MLFFFRWDQLEEGIKEQQKRQDAQSMQWSSYQETLQQTLAWLDAMEKTLQHDPAGSWASTQEIRSKLLKHKVIHHWLLYDKIFICHWNYNHLWHCQYAVNI